MSLRALLAVLIIALVPSAARAADLTIWWTKGISREEDDLLKDAVALWEKETGKKAELSFYASSDTATKTIAALGAGQPPDVTFDFNYDLAFTPTWAFEGQLADLTDVIEPIKGQFDKAALDSVNLLNGKTGKRAYQAVPWSQMTSMIHYWADLLEKAGLKAADIPEDWEGFFGFWCERFQPAVRRQGVRMFGVGQGSSTASNDVFFNVHYWLRAYGVEVVSPEGRYRLAEPEMRRRAIAAIDSYMKPIKAGCAPSDAVSWKGPDDNLSFLAKKHMLEMNPTLSIPVSQLPANPDNYYRNIVTRPWPNDMAGKPMPAMVSVKQILVFRTAPHLDNAKSFVRLLLRPEVIGGMLKGGQGRFTPVMPALLADPFYADPADPHRSAMYRQFTSAPNEQFPHVYNHRYAKVMSEAVWAKALGRIIADGWSSERSIDELIARIGQIMAEG